MPTTSPLIRFMIFPGIPPAGAPILHMGTDIEKHHKG